MTRILTTHAVQCTDCGRYEDFDDLEEAEEWADTHDSENHSGWHVRKESAGWYAVTTGQGRIFPTHAEAVEWATAQARKGKS